MREIEDLRQLGFVAVELMGPSAFQGRFTIRRPSITTFRRIPEKSTAARSAAVRSRHSGRSLCTIHTSA